MSQNQKSNKRVNYSNNQESKNSFSKREDKFSTEGQNKQLKSTSPLKSFGRIVKRPLIKEAVKEVTAGGVVYRINKAGVIEILLAQDSRDRWTIPKGHVEPGEITSQTAEREVREETDLQEMKVYEHLGKSTFQYRRQNTLVLMTMHIFLIEARGDTSAIRTVDPWMKSIGWFEFSTALDLIQYEAIETLMLVGLRKIRERTPGAKISA
ncbi:MAG: NUDIX domain-containing protein [Candidatus Nomurabacteria bacterium]|nr:MAG: NUDIX domain-containing protein [Candidatus Nomurabacteria bacterium]HRV76047.1 NUDIX domain-containing protein [Candidatus Saccharimonadales bacterium]